MPAALAAPFPSPLLPPSTPATHSELGGGGGGGSDSHSDRSGYGAEQASAADAAGDGGTQDLLTETVAKGSTKGETYITAEDEHGNGDQTAAGPAFVPQADNESAVPLGSDNNVGTTPPRAARLATTSAVHVASPLGLWSWLAGGAAQIVGTPSGDDDGDNVDVDVDARLEDGRVCNEDGAVSIKSEHGRSMHSHDSTSDAQRHSLSSEHGSENKFGMLSDDEDLDHPGPIFADPVQLALATTYKLNQGLGTDIRLHRVVLMQNLLELIYSSWSNFLPAEDFDGSQEPYDDILSSVISIDSVPQQQGAEENVPNTNAELTDGLVGRHSGDSVSTAMSSLISHSSSTSSSSTPQSPPDSSNGTTSTLDYASINRLASSALAVISGLRHSVRPHSQPSESAVTPRSAWDPDRADQGRANEQTAPENRPRAAAPGPATQGGGARTQRLSSMRQRLARVVRGLVHAGPAREAHATTTDKTAAEMDARLAEADIRPRRRPFSTLLGTAETSGAVTAGGNDGTLSLDDAADGEGASAAVWAYQLSLSLGQRGGRSSSPMEPVGSLRGSEEDPRSTAARGKAETALFSAEELAQFASLTALASAAVPLPLESLEAHEREGHAVFGGAVGGHRPQSSMSTSSSSSSNSAGSAQSPAAEPAPGVSLAKGAGASFPGRSPQESDLLRKIHRLSQSYAAVATATSLLSVPPAAGHVAPAAVSTAPAVDDLSAKADTTRLADGSATAAAAAAAQPPGPVGGSAPRRPPAGPPVIPARRSSRVWHGAGGPTAATASAVKTLPLPSVPPPPPPKDAKTRLSTPPARKAASDAGSVGGGGGDGGGVRARQGAEGDSGARQRAAMLVAIEGADMVLMAQGAPKTATGGAANA